MVEEIKQRIQVRWNPSQFFFGSIVVFYLSKNENFESFSAGFAAGCSQFLPLVFLII